MDEWIDNNFQTINQNELLLKTSPEYVMAIPRDNFIEMFGEVISEALNQNIDVKEAIRRSDPENNLGFNDLI
ncbi:hypothetical protein [Paenibacillus sp. FSL K6-1318]|uniref:hypothetical protein n=1 Tax=Paenibacillus sp. FSL K6-1318 TaxID=2975291 RepID=UPI0030EF8854